MDCGEPEPYDSPPLFLDLGKRTSNLFTENYFLGIVHFLFKAKSISGIGISAMSNRNTDSMKMDAMFTGEFEAFGFKFSENWNTDNVFETTVSANNMFFDGMLVDLGYIFAPHDGRRAGAASVSYVKPTWNAQMNFKNEFGGVIGNLNSVATYNNWLAGGLLSFDICNKELTEANFAVGYYTEEFFLTTNVKNGSEFCGSIYNRVNERLESGVQLAWSSIHNATRFGLGCEFKVDSNTLIAGKINNLTQIGVSFCTKMNSCISLTASALLDAKKINEGGHQIGAGIRFQN